jgi:hypothetical protein
VVLSLQVLCPGHGRRPPQQVRIHTITRKPDLTFQTCATTHAMLRTRNSFTITRNLCEFPTTAHPRIAFPIMILFKQHPQHVRVNTVEFLPQIVPFLPQRKPFLTSAVSDILHLLVVDREQTHKPLNPTRPSENPYSAPPSRVSKP